MFGVFFMLAAWPLSVAVVFGAEDYATDNFYRPRSEYDHPPRELIWRVELAGVLLTAATGLPAVILSRRARRYIDPRLPEGARRARTALILGLLTIAEPFVIVGGIHLLFWFVFRNGLV